MDYSIYTASGSREYNEDRAVALNENGKSIFVICDGLGGHGRGSVASALVSKKIGEALNASAVVNKENTAAAFEAAQDSLLKKQAELNCPNAMKTTAVVLWTDNKKAIWGHIGDSRLYVFRKNKVAERTIDHSVPQMLVFLGEIAESEIRHHPDRNRLIRVMGSEWADKKYDIAEERDLESCQAFLLCTDGFWENIEEKTMCSLLKKNKTSRSWLAAMAKEVKKNGNNTNMDNNTAIAVIV